MNGPQLTSIGRLTRDPELQYTVDNGIPYTRITIAVNTNMGPEHPGETHYFNTTLWRKQAEYAVDHCRRGTTVFLQGRFSFREFTRNDGTKGYSHDVTAHSFHAFPTHGPSPTDEQLAEVDRLPDSYDPPPGASADAPAELEPNPVSVEDHDNTPDPDEAFNLSQDTP